jgi:hypothetical protein
LTHPIGAGRITCERRDAQAADLAGPGPSREESIMSTSDAIPSGPHPDRIRQALNLALALAQPITTVLCFALGMSFDEDTRSSLGEPPIVPAGYTFTIWSAIYAGAIV